jgi:Fe-S cluster assembly protein SufD
MLSDDARMDAKPQLEIYADDVKCTHGATVGRLDEDALYYLRSRGITAHEARKMLTLAFGKQVIDRFEFEPLRKKLELQVMQRLEEVTG